MNQIFLNIWQGGDKYFIVKFLHLCLIKTINYLYIIFFFIFYLSLHTSYS